MSPRWTRIVASDNFLRPYPSRGIAAYSFHGKTLYPENQRRKKNKWHRERRLSTAFGEKKKKRKKTAYDRLRLVTETERNRTFRAFERTRTVFVRKLDRNHTNRIIMVDRWLRRNYFKWPVKPGRFGERDRV